MPIRVGDRVAYSAQWCRSVGAITGEIPALRGRVISVQEDRRPHLATVQWDDGEESKVLLVNLAKVGLNTRFSQC